MGFFERLHPRFRVDAWEPPATLENVQELKDFSCIPVPFDYTSLVLERTEVEILVDGERYIRIWSPLDCIEMNEAHFIQKYIPNSLAIGDDEGGSALILMSGPQGPGIYKVGFGALDVDESKYISASIEALLINGEIEEDWFK